MTRVDHISTGQDPDTAPLHHTLAHTQRDPTCSPTMETRKIPDFAGTWVMKSSENFDELLKKLGKWKRNRVGWVVGWILRREARHDDGLMCKRD